MSWRFGCREQATGIQCCVDGLSHIVIDKYIEYTDAMSNHIERDLHGIGMTSKPFRLCPSRSQKLISFRRRMPESNLVLVDRAEERVMASSVLVARSDLCFAIEKHLLIAYHHMRTSSTAQALHEHIQPVLNHGRYLYRTIIAYHTRKKETSNRRPLQHWLTMSLPYDIAIRE